MVTKASWPESIQHPDIYSRSALCQLADAGSQESEPEVSSWKENFTFQFFFLQGSSKGFYLMLSYLPSSPTDPRPPSPTSWRLHISRATHILHASSCVSLDSRSS